MRPATNRAKSVVGLRKRSSGSMSKGSTSRSDQEACVYRTRHSPGSVTPTCSGP